MVIVRAAVFLAYLTWMPSVAGAQTVQGSVLDSATGVGIENAAVTLFPSDSTIVRVVLSGPVGQFAVSAPEPGPYRLRVRRLGYATVVTDIYEVVQDSSLSVELRLEPEAIEVPGVIVTAESRWGRDKFTRRMLAGNGVFVGPDRLAALVMRHPGDAFRGLEGDGVRLRWDYGVLDPLASSARGIIPRVESAMGKGCFRFLLNEVPVWKGEKHLAQRSPWTLFPLSTVRPEDIMGIEIYRHLSEVPAEFRNLALRPALSRARAVPPGSLGPSRITDGDDTCGVVVIWTKVRW